MRQDLSTLCACAALSYIQRIMTCIQRSSVKVFTLNGGRTLFADD